ncbi:hypothetical protein ACRAVF_26995 [Bradyrhizobium oligotrophicum S58]
MGIQLTAHARRVIDHLVAEEIGRHFHCIIATLPPADPFGLDGACIDPAGHHTIIECGDAVCAACGKVF